MSTWIKERLNWKVLLMSLLINMVAISITALILPGIEIIDYRLVSIALMAVVLGLLNTFLKPLLSIITIRLLFVTYGLILIATNTLLLYVLSWIFSDTLYISNIWWAMLGAIMIAIISLFLDYMFGVVPPIGHRGVVEEQGMAI